MRHNRLAEANALAGQLSGEKPDPQLSLRIASLFLTEGAVEAGDAWLKAAGDQTSPSFLHTMVLYQQGKAVGDQRRIEWARARLELLLQEKPDSLAILNNLAWLLAVDLQRPDLALPYVERILSLTGGQELSAGQVDTIAEVLQATGRTPQALGLVRQAILANPLNGVLRYHSGVIQLATLTNPSQTGPALKDLELAVSRARLSPTREARVAALQQRFHAP